MNKLKFNDFVDMAVFWDGENEEIDCDLTLKVEGKKFKAYTCSVAHRDLLFFCDKGTLNYVVDTYGDKHIAELFNIEED